MRSLSKFLDSLLLGLIGVVMILVFQNCGTTEAGTNYLYESSLTVGCVGLSCEKGLDQVAFKSTVSGIMIDKPEVAQGSDPTCNSSNCFDVGGFCEDGGYPETVFYYQWFISNASGTTSPLKEIRTTARCNENGRFHVRIKIPSGKDRPAGFWDRSHRLRLFMKVIDEEGAELTNPTKEADFSYMISVRN
jgi:hypothetical protein